MPIPKPKPDEDHDEFVSRCMADDVMRKEYPERDQRFAVCNSQWKLRNDSEDEDEQE